MLGVYTIVKPAAEQGWGSAQALGLGAVALALLVAFVVREATARTPLMPLRLFRSRNVAGANLVQALSVAGMFGMFFMGSLYLQRVLGYDPLEIGLAFLPVTLVMGTLSVRYSERLVTRFGARRTLIPGLVLVAAGLGLFTQVPADGAYVVDVLPSMILIGAGAGTAFPALMNIAMSGATPSDAGLASGLVNTTMQVGGALGLAVLATLATTRTNSLRGAGESTVDCAHRRLPPRVPDRGRARPRRAGGRADRAAAGAPVGPERRVRGGRARRAGLRGRLGAAHRAEREVRVLARHRLSRQGPWPGSGPRRRPVRAAAGLGAAPRAASPPRWRRCRPGR